MTVEIQGFVDPRFAGVREEFERNFTERGDVGASVCILVDGEEVVNLWGGQSDPATGAPWREDTITVTMSTTKGVTALCAHILADRGLLDFDAPVAHYWPEFAANGKGSIPVRMLLNHQAGLPTIRRRIPEGKFLDWEYMVDVLANEDLRWEPGTRFGYHTVNYGWLVGEVVRRAAGKTVGTIFREEVGDPLKLDYWVGLPEEQLGRVTPLRPDPNEEVTKLLAADPDPESPFRLVFTNTGGFLEPNGWNTKTAWQSELCASGGIGNARAVARMYAPLALGGTFEGLRLVDPATIARMGAVQSALELDATGRSPLRVTLGFLKVGTDYRLPESIFGHGGWGGSMGFADPEARLSFGYVMNQMSSTDRFGPLATAAYRALGYRPGQYGLWLR